MSNMKTEAMISESRKAMQLEMKQNFVEAMIVSERARAEQQHRTDETITLIRIEIDGLNKTVDELKAAVERISSKDS